MMRLSAAAAATSGRTSGGDPEFNGVSTDTRTLRPGDLFVALRGERFDGHGFLGQAKASGAVAAMVDRKYGGEFPMPVVVVVDTMILRFGSRGSRARMSCEQTLTSPTLTACIQRTCRLVMDCLNFESYRPKRSARDRWAERQGGSTGACRRESKRPLVQNSWMGGRCATCQSISSGPGACISLAVRRFWHSASGGHGLRSSCSGIYRRRLAGSRGRRRAVL